MEGVQVEGGENEKLQSQLYIGELILYNFEEIICLYFF